MISNQLNSHINLEDKIQTRSLKKKVFRFSKNEEKRNNNYKVEPERTENKEPEYKYINGNTVLQKCQSLLMKNET